MISSADVVARGQQHDLVLVEAGRAQRRDEPVRGERIAAGGSYRHPVAERQRLEPECVHGRLVAGRVDGEHLTASRPDAAAGLRERVTPVVDRAGRPGGLRARVRRRRRSRDHLRRLAHDGDRQPGGAADHVLVVGDRHAVDDSGVEPAGARDRRHPFVDGQRVGLPQRRHRAGHEQARHQAQLGQRVAGDVADRLPLAGLVGAGRAERVEHQQVAGGSHLVSPFDDSRVRARVVFDDTHRAS